MMLSISTLGGFDIKLDGQSILSQSGRSYKLNKLFEYFITFRNKKLLPEMIMDNLFSESESDDPKNMLRTQIFRLRKNIRSFLPDDIDESEYLAINFTNGYYCLDLGEKIEIDVDEFEMLINQGDKSIEYEPEAAIDFYYKAINLYKGLYLSDMAYEVWLVSTRNYYQRLYLRTIKRLVSLLNERDKTENIIALCEQALLIEPYEESINIYLMEAMLHQGQQKNALNHYEYSLKMLKKELNAEPSSSFKEMLNKIQSFSSENSNVDFNSINDILDSETAQGPVQCNIDSFKFLLNVQKRKALRYNQNDYLCIMDIMNNNNKKSKEISEILKSSLRRGDVFTFWNQSNIMIMLHNVDNGGIDVVRKRIYDKINDSKALSGRDVKFIYSLIADKKIVPMVGQHTK